MTKGRKKTVCMEDVKKIDFCSSKVTLMSRYINIDLLAIVKNLCHVSVDRINNLNGLLMAPGCNLPVPPLEGRSTDAPPPLPSPMINDANQRPQTGSQCRLLEIVFFRVPFFSL